MKVRSVFFEVPINIRGINSSGLRNITVGDKMSRFSTVITSIDVDPGRGLATVRGEGRFVDHTTKSEGDALVIVLPPGSSWFIDEEKK